jgi:hypothetical protein
LCVLLCACHDLCLKNAFPIVVHPRYSAFNRGL